jgi:hypothetical protein
VVFRRSRRFCGCPVVLLQGKVGAAAANPEEISLDDDDEDEENEDPDNGMAPSAPKQPKPKQHMPQVRLRAVPAFELAISQAIFHSKDLKARRISPKPNKIHGLHGWLGRGSCWAGLGGSMGEGWGALSVRALGLAPVVDAVNMAWLQRAPSHLIPLLVLCRRGRGTRRRARWRERTWPTSPCPPPSSSARASTNPLPRSPRARLIGSRQAGDEGGRGGGRLGMPGRGALGRGGYQLEGCMQGGGRGRRCLV